MSEIKKNSILIVDDETSNIITLTHILQSEYTVFVAKNGLTAIDAAIKHQPDVILLDIIMPEMDGYIVIAALKELEQTRGIPVIFITGLSEAADEERGLALGAADYLIKPFSPALVKLRVSHQIKLIEQFRRNEYDIMKYKLSNDALNIALWDMDVVSDDPINPDNKFTWSQEFRQMLGYSDESDFPNLLQSWSNRLHPDERGRVLNAFAEHMTDYSGKTPYDVISRIMTKTGEYRYFRALGTTHRDSQGVPIRTAGALMDITGQKELESGIAEVMAKSEEDAHWYKSILDAIPLPITVTDTDMNWTFVNRATEDFLGMTFDDMRGKPCTYWASEICNTERCGIACFKRGIKRTFFNHKNSSYQIDVEDLHDIEGNTAGYIEVVQDITNIQQLAKERAEVEMGSKAKSAFLANMSHEIRTPMNAIWGITEILIQDDNLPEKVKEGLHKIYNSCDLLLGIINDILDFSKIEAGKLDILPAEYSVSDLINDSINLNIMRIGDKPIEFEVHVDESIPAKLIGDQLRIKQIMNNILSNAFKYTDKGKVTLNVFSEVIEDSNAEKVTLVISVQDTGLGMTEEQVGKLFDEYSRFHQATSRSVEGTGLGLSITQRLISLMDGKIEVDSEPGKGTLFTIRLPHVKSGDEIIGAKTAENLHQFHLHYITSRKKSKIVKHAMPYGSVLIVDDVETNLYVAEGLMKPYRLQIDTVKSGFAAIDRVKNGKVYDIIFMDHMMPEMDGITATKYIRDFGYDKPVVALTANAVSGQAELFLQNGFDEFISKPIDIRQLNAVLNKLIRDKYPPEIRDAAEILPSTPATPAKSIDPRLLEPFLRDARKTASLIETCGYTGQDLQVFTIAVHGVKSALAGIGEAELSKEAYALEQAAKRQDVSELKNSAPEFLLKLQSLIEKYEAENDDSEDDIFDTAAMAILAEKLSAVKDLCESYNRKEILDTLAEIEAAKLQKTAKNYLQKIKEAVLHSEFEDAANTAAECIEWLSASEPEPDGEDSAELQALKDGISGMDVEKGLERYGGNAETYLRILRSFATGSHSMLDSLETFSEKDLKNYEITVHGFKGMCFDLFADRTGEKAKELEFAAKAGNVELIREKNPLLLQAARGLVGNVEATLKA
ncbi:MAG: response regulator, partial [Oscillospiraceae bacterium]|nr:response regulator [Oscillospiraceae bacterium]